MENKYKTAIENLIEDEQPSDYISWLFDIQNSMIAQGATEALTDRGRDQLTGRFSSLKNFFQELQQLRKQ